MKHNVFSIRLPADLTARLSRQAADRGITRNAYTAHVIERGLTAQAFAELLEAEERRRESDSNDISPSPTAWERLLFMACFTQALLKGLNALLNRSTAEVGKLAATARDQATAETRALLSPSAPPGR